MIRKIISYQLVFWMLISNIGVPVFTHICHGLNRSWASIVIPAKSCCSKDKTDGCTDSCKKTETSSALNYTKAPCCDSYSDWAQLDADIIMTGSSGLSKSQQPADLLSTPARILISEKIATEVSSVLYHPPPLILSGRTLLLSKQVLRI